ncbi:hypothetical protein DTO96_100112 [Ephemeroptericola cinctiostellae]|uniref:Organic solvent tolerance-like N-terminal domain-containing protein n=1 Tax=Ephemeroptericola cinctiostellae TaxID=2268024 RepID=A0A345D7S1_9BURK|nr:hypothetical protein [Ephemeroptericola cinctiostellae]AXF84409.1 hypothetical protein DTO96_100112 [Ephemeroptericola cinctiostellae]
MTRMKFKITFLLLSLWSLTNEVHAETSDAESQKIIANQEGNLLNGQAAIRVSNANKVELFPNTNCINSDDKKGIQAAAGGAGFSMWGKPKRVGMPSSKLSENGSYAEYNVAANAPLILKIETETLNEHTRFICLGASIKFTPLAGHNYEVYMDQDFYPHTCKLSVSELAFDPLKKLSTAQPFPLVKAAKKCSQDVSNSLPTTIDTNKQNVSSNDVQVTDEVVAGKLHSRKIVFLKGKDSAVGEQILTYDVYGNLIRADLSGDIPTPVSISGTEVFIAPKGKATVLGKNNYIHMGSNSKIEVHPDGDINSR